MSTLYEYYNTGDDYDFPFYGATWKAQTFTPSIAHTITSVKLLLFRVGSPGTITVSIRATDGSGHPTGADLCSGTTDGNTLPTASPYEWREITLGAGYDLSASTKYAIVVRVISGNSTNYLRWRYDTTSPTYTGGCRENSTNSGDTWSSSTAYDCMFEEWGPSLGPTEKTSSDTGSGAEGLTSGNPVATLIKAETGAGLDVVAQAQAILEGAESGSGADAYVSLVIFEARFSSDAGSGVEGIPVPSAILAGSETGAGIEALIARLLASFDTGYGVEVGSVEVGGLLEELFASELGQGIDALVVKREIFAGGEGTKFFGGGHEPPHRAS